jgi:protoporphyrinogen oxidase
MVKKKYESLLGCLVDNYIIYTELELQKDNSVLGIVKLTEQWEKIEEIKEVIQKETNEDLSKILNIFGRIAIKLSQELGYKG